ncbi:MAG: threonine--tRNA ligase, partial [Thermoleophilia bacterium]|nr:threonine--tRNA ligase [Thermoleophilia bacterium]
GATGYDLARAIGEGLARAAVAVEIEGETRDLRLPLPDGATVRILTDRDPEALAVLRHSAAHLMAEAVTALYPGTKVSIGPAIDNGFYYDFEFPDGVSITEADLATIEAKLKSIMKEGRSWSRTEVTRSDARERFKRLGEKFKVELIDALPDDETITLYTQGEFVDLCRGPHVQETSKKWAVKLQSVAGAYWRGDSDREQLTRIYGTAFFKKDELATHLENLERAKKNDHRRLGTQLDLFSFHDISPGGPFWHPRGLSMWNALTDMWRGEHLARGYQEVKTPILYNPELWKKSGHWEAYRDNMFITQPKPGDDRQYSMKPMNCPAHCTILKTRRLSWRDLPVRMNEQGLVHRYEPGGVLHGLMRVRHITQDDGHIFCSMEQVLDEVSNALQFVLDLYKMFGFNDYTMELSTRPAKSIGSDEMWELAESMLAEALVRNGIEYKLNPGDGAFYGPKIDFHIHDSMNRTWQCGTIQLDFSMPSPERFDLTYTGQDNEEHQLVMIHRALLGSMERFIGILIEHYGGEFPLWLAPMQATVITVSDRHEEYANQVAAQLREAGLRADVDARTESIGRKIRDNEQLHTPVLLVVGESELETGVLKVRRRAVAEQQSMTTSELAAELSAEVAERRLSEHVTL